MGHTLKIVSELGTIDLTAGVYTIARYAPAPPKQNRETVIESATIIIDAANVAALQSAIRDIEEAFYLARERRMRRAGDRVYVTFLQDGGAATYRSEIYAENINSLPGIVTVDSKWLRGPLWDDQNIQIAITWERRAFWEADSETELSLSNGGGSGTGGRTIYNPHTAAVFTDTTVSFATANSRISDSGNGFGIFAVGDVISLRGSTINDGVYTVEAVDGGGAYIDVNQSISNEAVGDTINIYDIQNYVHIDAASITGAMPCPLRIAGTNSDAGADLETLWLYANINSTPDEFPHILEIEDSNTGSDTADSDASSGQYRQYSVTTIEAKITGWTLPSQLLDIADGAYFRVMARFWDTTDITNVRFRIKLLYSGQVIFDGGQVEFDDTYASTTNLFRELDTIQLPPLREVGTPRALTLELWGESSTEATETPKLDFLMLLPTDSYQKLKSVSGVAQNSILYEDGILDARYQEISSQRIPDVMGYGGPIWGVPGKDLRIYFCQNSETNDTADINRAMSIRCYIRPRVATL